MYENWKVKTIRQYINSAQIMIIIFPLQDTFIVSISLTHYFTFNFKIKAVFDNSFDPVFGETKKWNMPVYTYILNIPSRIII